MEDNLLLFYAIPFIVIMTALFLGYPFQSTRSNNTKKNKLLPNWLPIKRKTFDPNKKIENPFIAGSLVRYGQFFGREDVIQRLFNLWRDFPNIPLQNAAIYGEKRIGKTSLLKHLKDLSDTESSDPRWRKEQKLNYLSDIQNYHFIYISFQDNEHQTQQGLLQYILYNMELKDIDNVDLSLPDDKPLLQFERILINHLDNPTIILLDELGVALTRHQKEFNVDFWDGLRFIATSRLEPQCLAFVISAHEPPLKLAEKIAGEGGSPFFNILGETIELNKFTDFEAKALTNSSPEKFSKDDIKFILEKSGNKPYLLQILCRTRLEYLLLRKDDSKNWQKEGLEKIALQIKEKPNVIDP